MRRRTVVAAAAALALVLAGPAVVLLGDGSQEPQPGTELVRVQGVRETDGLPVNIDGTLYLPASTPAPAVLMAHGLGGTKASLAADARELARRGYVVLAYTARGFGNSGGRTHLDSPDYEVKDAQRLLDHLASRPEVRQDAAGDPRVGVVGASYGGALALLLAGTDRRVDALVPSITWNDLRQALLPQFAVTGGAPGTAAAARPIATTGVLKRQWVAALFGSAVAAGAPTVGPVARPPAVDSEQAAGLATAGAACGRVALDLCAGYARAATTGRPGQDLLDLLAASSPARVAGRITAPTLLVQGQSDALFPLSEADATASAIAAAGTPVTVVWRAGGHDGGPDESERLRELTAAFLDRVLGRSENDDDADDAIDDYADRPAGADRPFQVTVPDAVVSAADTNPAPQQRSAATFPGLAGAPVRTLTLPLAGPEQLAFSPPGATPAALTSLPGVGGALDAIGALGGQAGQGAGGQGGGTGGGQDAGGQDPGGQGGGQAGGAGQALAGLGAGALPGQYAAFETAPLPRPVTVVGGSRVTLRVRSTAPDATLFVSLQDVAPDGSATLPRQLVSPVRLEGAAARGAEVTVALPAVVRDVPAGNRLRVLVSSTDQGYALPADARGYRVSLGAAAALTVPQVPLEIEESGAGRRLVTVALALLALVVVGLLLVALLARRVRRRDAADPVLAGVPVTIEGLGKRYGNGFRAVSDLDLRVEHGQVLGLLGPNGAGKTTTLRMLMGLIHPTEGTIRLFGHRVRPGAPVLSRVGAFVEGPGFLPHLTGLANLELFWQATGRPVADAHLAEALEVAGLGRDVRRTVRTYSHGMKQRLGIAQAMLGLPELLVLDEPTNGLDPPQIREMRDVLARYAASGRTVVVSSHLLAEVEQTCTHVVVMHQGRLVAQGPVAELVGAATLVAVDVDRPERAARLAERAPGVTEVAVTPSGLTARADAEARAELVKVLAADGVRVDRVAPQRGLEETFLHLVGES